MTDDQRREADGDLLIEREREMAGNIGDDEGESCPLTRKKMVMRNETSVSRERGRQSSWWEGVGEDDEYYRGQLGAWEGELVRSNGLLGAPWPEEKKCAGEEAVR